MVFLLIPITAWIVCGTLKFGFNVVSNGYDAIERIGHGGFPSNHTAIVSSVTWALIITGEWHTAGLALAVLMIVVFDAVGLRRAVGQHAAAINKLTGSQLRELMGHNLVAVTAGFLVGLLVAAGYNSFGAL